MSRITPEHIEAAEALLGLSWTATERAQMCGNLGGQIGSAKARRAMRLENSVPTAHRFDPRLPGFVMPSDRVKVETVTQAPALPSSDEDIAYAPLTHLSAWIKAGELSPVRLTRIYIERSKALDGKLECWAQLTPERALAEAAAAEAQIKAGIYLGALHGIPYGLKDLYHAKDTVTGWGAQPWAERVSEFDSTIVLKLRAAGAILLGKTSVGALAYNDIWYGGVTRNPWNLNEGSSGSSAGSASATAAGLCGFSIGTETLGSITSPSQRCGTTGLRPTFGRVSRMGGMSLCPSLDKVGPICRAVEDTALVLEVLNGYDGQDRHSIGAGFVYEGAKGIEGLRVGYLPAAFGEGATDVDHAALAAARRLTEVREVALPDLPYGALMNVLYAEAAALMEPVSLDNLDDTLTWQEDGAWPNTFRKAWFLSAVDHVNFDRLRYRVMEALDELFREVDVLIGPFQTGPMLVASNYTGHPCLHLRAGFLDIATRSRASLGTGALTTGEAGEGKRFRVPQGISLWGGLFNEDAILRFGQALETELGVRDLRPGFAS